MRPSGSVGIYDQVFRRRFGRPVVLIADRYDDNDIGAVTQGIAHVSRKDAERHRQILQRSLRQTKDYAAWLLEIGCGSGGYLRWLANQLHAPALGIDVSPVAVTAAGRGTSKQSDIWFLASDAKWLALADQIAGAAFAIDTLYLIEDRGRLLKEIHRVLVHQAALVFTILHTGPGVERTLIEWRQELEKTGYHVVTVRDLSAAWQAHMVAKHTRRWLRRHRLRRCLGTWIEPELAVSAAMLGVGGSPSVALCTTRYEFVAVRR